MDIESVVVIKEQFENFLHKVIHTINEKQSIEDDFGLELKLNLSLEASFQTNGKAISINVKLSGIDLKTFQIVVEYNATFYVKYIYPHILKTTEDKNDKIVGDTIVKKVFNNEIYNSITSFLKRSDFEDVIVPKMQ